MKHKALFSSKHKSKKKKIIKVSSAAIMLGSFSVNFMQWWEEACMEEVGCARI